MSGSIIIKGVVNKQDINTQERTFGAWASCEIIDRQGDFIAMSEFRPALEKLMASGRRISINDSHTNHVCGFVKSYEFKIEPTSAKEGLYITAKIYSDYDSDTDIWNAILEGKYTGISLGGKAGNKEAVCGESGCYNILTDIEIWEFSLVETPANQEALIDSVNKLAKSYKLYRCYPIQKYVKRCADKFCVYSESGKRLGTHATEEDANTQLRAIEVNKGFFSSVLAAFDSMGDYALDEWVEEHWVPYKRPESAWGDRIKEAWNKKTEEYNSKIHKSKVYIKTPSEAPPGVKINTGERGGQYYESEPGHPEQQPSQQTQVQTQVQTPVEQPKFQSKNSIWDKYAEGMKNDPDGKINEAYWKEKTEWTHNIQRALALNQISEADARKLGWYGTEAVQPLPQVLYHVTTAKDAVERTGLKTRDELNMESGLGLGGGQSDTVSFTENPEIAKAIKTVMIEAQKVASGKITLQDLINQAKSGIGAKKSWYDEWEKSSKLTYGSQLEDTLNGVDHDYSFSAETPEDYNAGKAKMNYSTGWVGVGESRIGADGKIRYNRWQRKLTSDDINKNTFELYKFWIAYRENAGGIMDPVFFLSNPKALAQLDPLQIESLEFRSKPGAKGFQMSALGEWRTWSGDAVQLMGIKKAKVYIHNPAEAPKGARLGRGPHGGIYYETGLLQAPSEIPRLTAPVKPAQLQPPQPPQPQQEIRTYDDAKLRGLDENQYRKYKLDHINVQTKEQVFKEFKRRAPNQGIERHINNEDEMHVILALTKYALVSAGRNPNNDQDKNLSDVQITDRHNKLKQELIRRGYVFTPVVGNYGAMEDSFLVMMHDADEPEASEIGKIFNQDSVIVVDHGRNSMIYTTGDKAGKRLRGEDWQFLPPEQKEYYTEIAIPNAKPFKFSLNFDWDHLLLKIYKVGLKK